MRPVGRVSEEAADSSGGHPACSKSFPSWSEGSPLICQAHSQATKLLGAKLAERIWDETLTQTWQEEVVQEQHPLESPR